MSVEIIHVNDSQGVIIRLSDEVCGKEFIDAQIKVYQQLKKKAQTYHIIDKSWCSGLKLTEEELKDLCYLNYRMSIINSDLIIAVVDSTLFESHITEKWIKLTNRFIHYSKKFSRQIDAELWIHSFLNERVKENKEEATDLKIA